MAGQLTDVASMQNEELCGGTQRAVLQGDDADRYLGRCQHIQVVSRGEWPGPRSVGVRIGRCLELPDMATGLASRLVRSVPRLLFRPASRLTPGGAT
jgi:hypothetical protein